MTFLKGSIKDTLRTTNKSSRIVFVLLVAVAVISVGYITSLAILAPEQLAEAQSAATDLVCSGCVGSTDLANNAVTSGKIGNGQVHNADIGSNAVTGSKISDTDGVRSADIVDRSITEKDIALGSIPPPTVQRVVEEVNILPNDNGFITVDCPAGTVITGGGYDASQAVRVSSNHPTDGNKWIVGGGNTAPVTNTLWGYAVCIGPVP